MSLQLYLAFVAASSVMILIPGPSVLLTVAHALAYGAPRALIAVAGTTAAQIVQVTVTVVGITSVMLFMAAAFEWLRWLGVAYLIYLGVQHWRQQILPLASAGAPARSGHALFWEGFMVSLTNPKSLLFYAAFFPQFVDPAAPVLPQVLLLAVSMLAITALFTSGYALLAGRFRGWVQDPRRLRWSGRLIGSLLIGAAAGLAMARRG